MKVWKEEDQWKEYSKHTKEFKKNMMKAEMEKDKRLSKLMNTKKLTEAEKA